MPRRWTAFAQAIVEAVGHGRYRRRRRRLPVRRIRAWSRRRSKPISRSSTPAFEALPISYSAELWCEPGRALCAEYASLLVRVEKRRGDELYINDGAYGALFDAAHIGWRYPGPAGPRGADRTFGRWSSASTARPATTSIAWPARSSFRPTSAPAIISRSACSAPMAARCAPQFNGFGAVDTEIVDDEPMASLYGGARQPARSNVVKL